MIRFGSWSTTLGVAAAFGAVVALLLLTRRENRPANSLLSALLMVAVLRLMPYVLGFAGFYDAYPWLSFAPFDLALALGPLIYLYVRRLTAAAMPRGWYWHFAPAILDLAYTVWAFTLPLSSKLTWNDRWHAPIVAPVEETCALVSLGVYLAVALRRRRLYLAWLAEHVSDRAEHTQGWLAMSLGILGLWLLVATGFDLADMVMRLTYFDRFPQYLAFAAIVTWLGLEGWRHAGHRFPPMMAKMPDAAADPSMAGPDWRARGEAWAARLDAAGWWREPGLTLGEVAHRLATNETYVSRAFNEGLGRNFNAVVNGFRVRAVKAALEAGERDLLDLALRSGFSSKASFNRVFRDETGLSPSAWRKAQMREIAGNSTSETTRKRPAVI